MAKATTIGAMNAQIRIKNITTELDADGFRVETETDAIKGKVWCGWRWVHGKDQMDDRKLQHIENATITMRYTPKIDLQSRVYLCSEGDSAKPWEVLSIDNVDEKRTLLEIKVQRRAKA